MILHQACFFLVCILLSQSKNLNNFFLEEIPSFAPTGPPLYAGYHPNFWHYTLPVIPSHVPSTHPPRAPFIPYTPNSNTFQLLSSNSNPSANPPALDLPSPVPSSLVQWSPSPPPPPRQQPNGPDNVSPPIEIPLQIQNAGAATATGNQGTKA